MIVSGVAMLALLYARRSGPARRDKLYGVAAALAVAVVVCGVAVLYMGAMTGGGVRPYAVAGPDDLLEMDLNQAAEDFTYTRVDNGSTERLSDSEGKVVIINVWATWCAPCLQEIPELNRLQDRYRDDGLVVLSISDETLDELVAFEDAIGMNTLSAYAREMEQLPVTVRKAFEIRPTTYIVDRQGNYRKYILGARDYAYFEKAIKPYL